MNKKRKTKPKFKETVRTIELKNHIKTIKKTTGSLLTFEEVSYKKKPKYRKPLKIRFRKPQFLFYFTVAGMHHAIKNIKKADKLFEQMEVGEHLKIKHENKNHFDDHALAIYYQDQKLGYVPREINKDIIKFINKNKSFTFLIHKKIDLSEFFDEQKKLQILAFCHSN